MKILVLLSHCIPKPRANEICVSKMISSEKEAYATYVCTVDDEALLGERENDASVNGRVLPFYYKRQRSFSQRGFFGKIWYLMTRLPSVLFSPIYDRAMAKGFLRTAEKVMQEEVPDIVVAVLQPTAAPEAARRLKKRYPASKYVLYDLDTASDSSFGHFEKLLFPLYYKKVLHWEKKIYSAFDLIVHLDSHEAHFHKEQYRDFLPKTLFQGIPLLDVRKDGKSGGLKETPVLIYAGRFYPSLREPHHLLDVLSLANKKCYGGFSVDVYTDGEYVRRLLNSYSTDDGVFVHDYLSQDEINLKMEEADVLISLGNNGTNMFPSKIVTYVAQMKPIIHLYQSKDDPVISYLKKYPDVLLLDVLADKNENAEAIVNFLKAEHKPINRSEIEEIYRNNQPSNNMREIITRIGL